MPRFILSLLRTANGSEAVVAFGLTIVLTADALFINGFVPDDIGEATLLWFCCIAAMGVCIAWFSGMVGCCGWMACAV